MATTATTAPIASIAAKPRALARSFGRWERSPTIWQMAPATAATSPSESPASPRARFTAPVPRSRPRVLLRLAGARLVLLVVRLVVLQQHPVRVVGATLERALEHDRDRRLEERRHVAGVDHVHHRVAVLEVELHPLSLVVDRRRDHVAL